MRTYLPKKGKLLLINGMNLLLLAGKRCLEERFCKKRTRIMPRKEAPTDPVQDRWELSIQVGLVALRQDVPLRCYLTREGVTHGRKIPTDLCRLYLVCAVGRWGKEKRKEPFPKLSVALMLNGLPGRVKQLQVIITVGEKAKTPPLEKGEKPRVREEGDMGFCQDREDIPCILY